VTDFHWLLAKTSTATYDHQKDSRVYNSEQQAAVANQVFIIGLRTLNCPQSGKVQNQVQSKFTQSTVQSPWKIVTILFASLLWLQKTYIPWIQTYIKYFNVHTPYLLYRCLQIFGVRMAHSVYLIGCGLQNRGCMGRFQEILRIFSSPKYPDRLWARPTSLKWATNTVSP
jgi:hypothetical protein